MIRFVFARFTHHDRVMHKWEEIKFHLCNRDKVRWLNENLPHRTIETQCTPDLFDFNYHTIMIVNLTEEEAVLFRLSCDFDEKTIC